MRKAEEHNGQNVELKATRMRILVQISCGIMIMTNLRFSNMYINFCFKFWEFQTMRKTEEHNGKNLVIKATRMRILVQTSYGIIMTSLRISNMYINFWFKFCACVIWKTVINLTEIRIYYLENIFLFTSLQIFCFII